MMRGIRIRDTRGKILPLPPEAAIVELCSLDGKLARLILCGDDKVTILDPTDPEFRNYCKSLNLDTAEVIRLVDK